MRVTIPQDLNEITLKQMIQLADIEKLELDEVQKAKQVIKLLVDKVDDTNIDNIKMVDLLEMYTKLCSMTNSETALIKLVSIEGVKYGFNPDLENISTGEFMDIDTMCKDLDKNLHKVMAILYRKVITEGEGKYLIEPYDANIEDRAKLFLNKMPASVAQSSLVFFYRLGKDYLRGTMESLQVEQKVSKLQTSEKDGDGILS